jgi:hypothetical protein
MNIPIDTMLQKLVQNLQLGKPHAHLQFGSYVLSHIFS